MIVGFTGSRVGMTDAQFRVVGSLLRKLLPAVAHHGDCVGADSRFHELVRHELPDTSIVGHPPVNDKLQAHCHVDTLLLPEPYLKRNRNIVKAGLDCLIATPKESSEPAPARGQGTWSTIRHARTVGRLIYIVWPNGTVEVER